MHEHPMPESPEGDMKRLVQIYAGLATQLNYLQSPFLLAIRLYWGWQFAQTGWGKMHNIAKITEFFAGLGIPSPALNAHFISGLEFFGGLLLMLGLASRLTGFLLAANMLVAYWTADHDALVSVISDPGKFYVADPYTFLFASLLVLIFGAGALSADALFLREGPKKRRAAGVRKLSGGAEEQIIA
jgi:putative oxidoreductase